MRSMKGLRRDVQRACAQVEAIADTDGAVTLAAVERELWTALLRLARCAIALFLARQAACPRCVDYQHEGADYVFDRRRPARSEIGTRFGKVPFVRPVGRRTDGRRGPRNLPIDRGLGLVGGFSLGTVAAMTRLCAQMAFGSARSTFRSFCEWSPSQRAVLRMVDAAGAEARGFLEVAPPPVDDGDIFVIQVDGRVAPMIDAAEYERRRQPRQPGDGTARHQRRRRRRARGRPRRGKGDKSKNAKVAFVGAIYTLRVTEDGCDGPIGKRLYATFESHAALFAWLETEAKKRGYGTNRTLFLADGAATIWELQVRHFPDAEPCLDWYYVVEKLWPVPASFVGKAAPTRSSMRSPLPTAPSPRPAPAPRPSATRSSKSASIWPSTSTASATTTFVATTSSGMRSWTILLADRYASLPSQPLRELTTQPGRRPDGAVQDLHPIDSHRPRLPVSAARTGRQSREELGPGVQGSDAIAAGHLGRRVHRGPGHSATRSLGRAGATSGSSAPGAPPSRCRGTRPSSAARCARSFAWPRSPSKSSSRRYRARRRPW